MIIHGYLSYIMHLAISISIIDFAASQYTSLLDTRGFQHSDYHHQDRLMADSVTT